MKALSLQPTVFSMAMAARHLDTSNKLTEWALKDALKQRGILVSTEGGLLPNGRYNGLGYFTTVPKTHYIRGSIPRHYAITMITVKGLAWLSEELKKEPQKEAS